MDYWLGQLLSLIFYIMTLIVYNRARKEYVGGKIAAAINLIMIFLLILFANDFVDYFLVTIVPIEPDIITILKILIKLSAICVLFFGGLRFFVAKQTPAGVHQDGDFFDEMAETKPDIPEKPADRAADATLALEMPRSQKKPTLGRYEVLGQIGKGAMGIVYKGRDPKLNRLTAIKTIRFIDEYDEDKVEDIKAHFYREAEIVAKLSHKNIVTIFDVGEDLDVSYLAMEYLEGESLQNYTLQSNLLPIEKCIDIIAQVCDALDYAHRQGVIHRDIKPGNIMMLPNGVVKVTDFGIARAAGSTKTRTGIIKGTPFYMSPEQAKGVALTGASDIFSLGVVFYQLLTGMLPFSGDNLAGIMYQTTNVDPEPADSYNKDISQAVLRILDKALGKNPEDRFNSGKEMAAELRKLASGPVTDLGGAAEKISETEKEIIPGKNVVGTQEVARQDSDREYSEDTVDFEDLEQTLGEGILSASKREAAFKATEGLSEAEKLDLHPIEILSEKKEEKLDLSELREVLAERKRRLAQEDAGGAEREEQEAAAFGDSGKDEWGWTPGRAVERRVEKRKNALSGYMFQAIYAAIILLALAGAYYYFWMSPKSDMRLVRILYDKYFSAKSTSPEEMLAEQKRLVEQIMKEKLLEKQSLAQQDAEKRALTDETANQSAEILKEQQRIVQEKIEAERRKDQERLARIEAEKQKERERLARIEAEKQKEARIAAEKRMAQEAAERREKEKIEALVSGDMNNLKKLIASAEQYQNGKKYLPAKETLEKALNTYHESRFKNDPRMLALKKEIEEKLSRDEIVYGSKGFVYYNNQWLSPQAYEKILYAEGYVKYNNEFVKYHTLDKIITNKTKPLVTTFLNEKFKDTMVHSKNIKLIDISLEENSSAASNYAVDYKWEAWTFKGLSEGFCSIVVSYNVDADKWYLVKGCE